MGKKRIVVVHCWGGNPNDNWYPWLKRELENKGFSVVVPEMPDTESPAIHAWLNMLETVIPDPDLNTYFIGHSIGCQTILRYLAHKNAKVGGAVFVAGWFTLQGLETNKEQDIAKPWLIEPINFSAIKNLKSFALFSDNDPFVPIENVKLFEKNVGSKTLLLQNKGHFTADDGVAKVPEVLNKIIEWSR